MENGLLSTTIDDHDQFDVLDLLQNDTNSQQTVREFQMPMVRGYISRMSRTYRASDLAHLSVCGSCHGRQGECKMLSASVSLVHGYYRQQLYKRQVGLEANEMVNIELINRRITW